MGADAFYDLGTHSNSTKLVIQIVRMQEVALQRQDHERVYADPARNDPNIALAVRMPGPVAAPQSQNPRVYPDTVEGRFLAAQEHYAAQRAAARPAARAAGGGSGGARGGRGGSARTVRIDADRTEAVRHHSPNSQASQVIPRQAIQALLTQIPSKCGAVLMVQWPRRVPAGFTVATTCSGRFYSGHDVFRPVLQWPRRMK